MTNAILRGKPDAGNPHVRFDEGEVASAKPRRGSLLYIFFAYCVLYQNHPEWQAVWRGSVLAIWYNMANGETDGIRSFRDVCRLR